MTAIHGVAFADAQHRTIFADTRLQKMLNIPEADLGQFIGEPVHMLLGITSEAYNELTQAIQQAQQFSKDDLNLQNQSGDSLKVSVEWSVNKDANGNIMGLDFTFYQAAQISVTSDDSESTLSSEMAEEVLRYYFKRQIEGLYKVMTQVGGARLWQYLETAINATAEKNRWDVIINGNSVIINTDKLPFDAYQGLLFKAASYASTAVGNRLVKKRIAEIDAQSNPKTFEYIQSNWFEKLS
jgi:hypothetical protein